MSTSRISSSSSRSAGNSATRSLSARFPMSGSTRLARSFSAAGRRSETAAASRVDGTHGMSDLAIPGGAAALFQTCRCRRGRADTGRRLHTTAPPSSSARPSDRVARSGSGVIRGHWPKRPTRSRIADTSDGISPGLATTTLTNRTNSALLVIDVQDGDRRGGL